MTPSIFLFGASSILGFNLAKSFPSLLKPFVPPGNKTTSLRHWPVLNLEDATWITRQFEKQTPRILIYCHAVCDVPKCEADPDWAYEINVQNLDRVLEALPMRTRLVYLSSDHVFSGDGIYTEKSVPSPISVYGRTRVEAEQLVLKRENALVIRTGLAIGPSPDGRTGHMDWLSYRSERGLPITIIEDEYRSVVWARDLAERVLKLSESEVTGIRHIPATHIVSRVSLANHLLRSMGKAPKFKIEGRDRQPVPHLGRVELESNYDDAFSEPLPSVVDSSSEK